MICDTLSQSERALLTRYGHDRTPRYTSYPTAPHFSSDFNPITKETWLSSIQSSESTSVYLHIPFCRELCFYCGCTTKASRRDKPIKKYIKNLIYEIHLTGSLLKCRPRLDHIHWGGGTPNLLSVAQFQRVIETLKTYFDIDPDCEHALEIDPRTISDDLIEALPIIGINRVSFGIQDFDPQVQFAINRIQSFSLVKEKVEKIRNVGISGINFDLILGLPYQTLASFEDTLALCHRLSPDRLAIFGYAHLPEKLPHQRLIPEEALPTRDQRFLLEKMTRAALINLGYVEVGLDHFASPGDSLASQAIQETVSRNFQGYTTDKASTLIGFGVSAVSQFPQGFAQNHSNMPKYLHALLKDELPIARGKICSQEDLIRGALISQLMCSAKIDLNALPNEWNHKALDIWNMSMERLRSMQETGLIKLEQNKLKMTQQGKVFRRLVAQIFDAYSPVGKALHSATI